MMKNKQFKKSTWEAKKKLLLDKRNKPLVGNNRSRTGQARRVTKRKFNTNRQNFRIGLQNCYTSARSFRTYWKKLRET